MLLIFYLLRYLWFEGHSCVMWITTNKYLVIKAPFEEYKLELEWKIKKFKISVLQQFDVVFRHFKNYLSKAEHFKN